MGGFILALAPRLRQSGWWKHLFVDISVVVVFVSAFTIIAYFLQVKQGFATATLLLICLIILLFLAQKSGPRVTILSGILLCVTCDFFLIKPTFSFFLGDAHDVIALCVFLFGVLLVSGMFAQHRKIVKQTKYVNELESLRFQASLEEQRTEVIRREHELHAMYELLYLSRDRKDLKAQLKQMAQTITDTFHFCGVRGCAFYLFDPEGDASMWMLSSRGTDMPMFSHDEERSVMWVMRHSERVTLTDLPVVSRTPSSYLRRVVRNNIDGETGVTNCSYLVPLTSGEKTLAVMRLYVQENAHAELAAIKSILQGETALLTTHAELFSKLRDQTVNMIEQSLIERALNLRQDLQRRAEELHTAFLSSVSHDFHTPLTQIMATASGLLDRPCPWENEDACRESLQSIVSEAERLERIVGKILALTRIEYGAFTLKKELYPIETIILNALNQGHMRSLKHGRRIEMLVPDEVSAVEVDPDLIRQVFTNLIENAIRYTPAESPIEISVRADEKHMFVTVADCGPGIPADALELVFERFRRVKQEMPDNAALPAQQGSGLGLAICRGFVQAHGGRIWAENRKDGGAKFTFTLPLREAEGVSDEKDITGRR